MTFLRRVTDSTTIERGTTQEFELVYNDTTGKVGFMNAAGTFVPLNSVAYAVTTGTGAAYLAATSPDIALPNTDGQEINLKMHLANTSTTPTLAVNGATARTIVDNNGAAISVGELVINCIYKFVYNATANTWQLIGVV